MIKCFVSVSKVLILLMFTLQDIMVEFTDCKYEIDVLNFITFTRIEVSIIHRRFTPLYVINYKLICTTVQIICGLLLQYLFNCVHVYILGILQFSLQFFPLCHIHEKV